MLYLRPKAFPRNPSLFFAYLSSLDTVRLDVRRLQKSESFDQNSYKTVRLDFRRLQKSESSIKTVTNSFVGEALVLVMLCFPRCKERIVQVRVRAGLTPFLEFMDDTLQTKMVHFRVNEQAIHDTLQSKWVHFRFNEQAQDGYSRCRDEGLNSRGLQFFCAIASSGSYASEECGGVDREGGGYKGGASDDPRYPSHYDSEEED